jgi:hypothetical protein
VTSKEQLKRYTVRTIGYGGSTLEDFSFFLKQRGHKKAALCKILTRG